MTEFRHRILQLKHIEQLNKHEITRIAVLKLKGQLPPTVEIDGDYYHEQEMIGTHRKVSDQTALFQLFSTKLKLAVFFGDYNQAEQIDT